MDVVVTGNTITVTTTGKIYMEVVNDDDITDKVYATPQKKSGNIRPTLTINDVGYVFFDGSLSPARPVWWTGTEWVDATGVAVS